LTLSSANILDGMEMEHILCYDKNAR
jgi:hypothetical protein